MKRGESEERAFGFCFEFNGPRRGINSLEGNPLDPGASRRKSEPSSVSSLL